MDDQLKHYSDKLAYEIDSWDLKVALEALSRTARCPPRRQRPSTKWRSSLPTATG